jgi:hypothetical protein
VRRFVCWHAPHRHRKSVAFFSVVLRPRLPHAARSRHSPPTTRTTSVNIWERTSSIDQIRTQLVAASWRYVAICPGASRRSWWCLAVRSYRPSVWCTASGGKSACGVRGRGRRPSPRMGPAQLCPPETCMHAVYNSSPHHTT